MSLRIRDGRDTRLRPRAARRRYNVIGPGIGKPGVSVPGGSNGGSMIGDGGTIDGSPGTGGRNGVGVSTGSFGGSSRAAMW
jgi:hypothetical protein